MHNARLDEVQAGINTVKKNIYFCFIDYAKAFDCVDHIKLWKILRDMGIPDQNHIIGVTVP